MAGAALILSGGYAHPFEQSTAALAELIAAAGLAPRIVANVDEAIPQLAEKPALFAVNTLRWSMMQHEKYAPDRAEHAYALPDAYMAAIADYVAEGGTLFALHVSVISFDNQPGWRSLLGGGWQWGISHHPPMDEMTVQLTAAGAAISGGAERFRLVDEAYHRLDPAPDCDVLAHAASADGPQPLAWVRQYGAGRIAVNALGHDGGSIRAAGHSALILGQLHWLLGGDNA